MAFRSIPLFIGTTIFILLNSPIRAQNFFKYDSLFIDQKPLKIRLNYSNYNLNKNTNDSTFMKTKLFFIQENKNKEIDVLLRDRGNFIIENR